MPLPKGYAILKGTVIDSQLATGGSPHYQVRVVDDTTDYRISINVRSKYNPKELEYILIPNFQHPILPHLAELPRGLTRLSNDPQVRKTSGIALDFIRGNLFDRFLMQPIPDIKEGPDNDLNEKIDTYVQYAMGDERNLVYAFGEPWHEPNKRDQYFGFLPGNGIHDIHMNQGNLIAEHKAEDGVYQDGGLIFYLAEEDRYVGYFTKFQSQAWHTDDVNGHALPGEGGGTGGGSGGGTGGGGGGELKDGAVRIIAAMVNPVGPGPEKETVTILNTTNQTINLTGWKLADKAKNKTSLDGNLGAGATRLIQVKLPMVLSNNGGLITLLDPQGKKIHGVSYTKGQAGNEGETITFG